MTKNRTHLLLARTKIFDQPQNFRRWTKRITYELFRLHEVLAKAKGGGGESDQLQGRYGNPAQPRLSAKVAAGQENVFSFDLKELFSDAVREHHDNITDAGKIGDILQTYTQRP